MAVKWYGNQVKRMIEQETQRGAEALAYEIREHARRNLEEAGHVDTGFLKSGIYVATPEGTTPIPPDGTYTSTKGNGQVRRENGEIVQVSEGASLGAVRTGAIVGAAADYALYIELEDPFLFPAAEQTAGNADRILQALYR